MINAHVPIRVSSVCSYSLIKLLSCLLSLANAWFSALIDEFICSRVASYSSTLALYQRCRALMGDNANLVICPSWTCTFKIATFAQYLTTMNIPSQYKACLQIRGLILIFNRISGWIPIKGTNAQAHPNLPRHGIQSNRHSLVLAQLLPKLGYYAP